MKGQSHRHSIYESGANILIGYSIAVGAQILVFPLFGLDASISSNLKIGLIFTIISFIRSYSLRRFWNWVMVRDRAKVSGGNIGLVKEKQNDPQV